MQEYAAILECTEADMLTEEIRAKVKTAQGKAEILREFELLRAQVEAR